MLLVSARLHIFEFVTITAGLNSSPLILLTFFTKFQWTVMLVFNLLLDPVRFL